VRDDAEIPYELRIHFFLLPVFSVTRRNSNRLFGFFGGPACVERLGVAPGSCETHAALKPCRVKIQFATNPAARQHAQCERRNAWRERKAGTAITPMGIVKPLDGCAPDAYSFRNPHTLSASSTRW